MVKRISIFILTAVFMVVFLGVAIADQKDSTDSTAKLSTSTKAKTTNLAAEKSEKATKNDGPQPKIVFTDTEHDFGKHISGDVLEHVFKFRNTGKAELKIIKVKAG